jgi:hypothetical protein
MNNPKLPSIIDLYEDDLETAAGLDAFNALLNAKPKKEWIKEHPYIKVKDAEGRRVGMKYLTIGQIENLLRRIFLTYSFTITGQGTAFNGVWVTVRFETKNPVNGQPIILDGIGASELQTKSGTSPADLLNINSGALTMAFPAAETYARKNAVKKLGRLFGAYLNANEDLEGGMNMQLQEAASGMEDVSSIAVLTINSPHATLEELIELQSTTLPKKIEYKLNQRIEELTRQRELK